VSGPERFEAVLLLQQPALGNAVNEVTGCQSIGGRESIQSEFRQQTSRLDREESVDFQQCPSDDHDAGGGDRHRGDRGSELEEAGPPPGERAPFQEATGVEE
jgi:hypothetical protein